MQFNLLAIRIDFYCKVGDVPMQLPTLLIFYIIKCTRMSRYNFIPYFKIRTFILKAKTFHMHQMIFSF